MDLRKKTDVDIYEELSKLVDTHVKHYKEDFDLDQRLIMRAAKSELPEDRTLFATMSSDEFKMGKKITLLG